VTNMIPSLPFPDPSNQSPKSRAKRKWAPPTLTIEQVTHTAQGKSFVQPIEGTRLGASAGPAS